VLAPKTLASAKFQLTSVNLQTTGRYLKKFTRCVGLEKTNKAQSRYTLNDTFKQQLMASILVLHGPNLNLLGTREPGVYGSDTLADIDAQLQLSAKERGHHLQSMQSNAEYELIDRIHLARPEGINFIIFNPAAFTHTSIALRDALLAVDIPFIEVHLSNVHARDSFRHHSYFSDIARGVICGLGAQGYQLALQAAIDQLNQ
jgi:3-dehydroquinate dehydratase-2